MSGRRRMWAEGSVIRRIKVLATLVLLLLAVAAGATLQVGREQAQVEAALSTALVPALEANSTALLTMAHVDREWEDQVAGSAAEGPHAAHRAAALEQLDRLHVFLRRPTLSAVDRAALEALESTARRAASRWFAAVDAAAAGSGRSDVQTTARTIARRAFADFIAANGRLQVQLRSTRNGLADQATHADGVRNGIAVGVMVASAILVIGGATSVIHSLGRPLERLRAVVQRQGAGDVMAMADPADGPLELRALAREFNDLTRANSRLHDQQAEALRLHQMVLDVAAAIGASDDVGSALELVCARLGIGLGADRVLFYSLAKGSSSVEDRAEWHREALPPLSPLPRSLARQVRAMNRALRGQGYLAIEDLRAQPMASNPRAIAFHRATAAWAALLLPVGSGGRGLGVLAVLMVERPRAWRPAEVQAAQQFANIAAETIAQLRLAELQEEQVRRLMELDRHKTDFIGTVSHELRTPLTSIKGYVELLEDGDFGDVSPGQRTALGVIGRNASRLGGLIEDLLVLNKIESSGLSRSLQDVAVTDLVGQVVETIRPMAAAGDVSVVCADIAEDLSIHVDRGQLERVLINLGSNAVKFTPRGGTATFAARPIDGHVEISVSDTGIGIPSADLARLSERFFRAGNAHSAAIPGTGLGLTIVRSIVEGHGGTLRVSSVEGSGTTMRVLLPRSGTRGELHPVGAIAGGRAVTAPEQRRGRGASA
ncbi:MAG TPA: ATP-binding protein [Intrasporangium sp.]|uniref:sensor histidine kinase n=1 Tax=Intrasporangium sp. TaxID=1925024 RepID=UPI002D768219|nr:ATP-binding protein [Intrasporangium sp.]HET7399550.1 ATP-binding protein [Intrasporangium sp.]